MIFLELNFVIISYNSSHWEIAWIGRNGGLEMGV